VKVIDSAGRYSAPEGAENNHWVEHLSEPDLSIGTYSVPAGGSDDQSPHTEDEIYVVTRGHARLVAGAEVADVTPGSVVYVPAGEEHRFVDIAEDFAVLVLFAPAEYSRRT
jgi:mannose-6-phosphate isomerase-like protein (cupin superfamily)